MIKEAIQLLAQGNNLSKQQAYECMNEIMAGEASQIQMASYLTALSLKGETIDEITGLLEQVETIQIHLIFLQRLHLLLQQVVSKLQNMVIGQQVQSVVQQMY